MFCKKIYVHIKNICLTTIKYELYKKICAVKKYTKNVAKPTELLLALRAPPRTRSYSITLTKAQSPRSPTPAALRARSRDRALVRVSYSTQLYHILA